MKKLPESEDSLLLRTDFSDDAAWTSVCQAAQAETAEGFRAYISCIDDPSYDGLTADQLASCLTGSGTHSFVFLVDQLTLTHPENPILVVDLYHEPGRTFRVIPSEMWGVDNNLSIANMGYEEFADSVDPDGVFRGFPKS